MPASRRKRDAWLGMMIDGAEGFIDQQHAAGAGGTPELRVLGRHMAEAHDWLNDLGANKRTA